MTVRPADYPPPFSPAEFIGPPTDPPEERIEVVEIGDAGELNNDDIKFVGFHATSWLAL